MLNILLFLFIYLHPRQNYVHFSQLEWQPPPRYFIKRTVTIIFNFNRGRSVTFRVATRGDGKPRNFAQGIMVNTACRVTFLSIKYFKRADPIEKRLQKIANIFHTEVHTFLMFSI